MIKCVLGSGDYIKPEAGANFVTRLDKNVLQKYMLKFIRKTQYFKVNCTKQNV